jgi:hypothetical protein
MLTALVVLLRSIGLLCRGHRAVALENLALRQQLAALTRTRKRPQLSPPDRQFWILLAKRFAEVEHGPDGRAARGGRAMASPMAPLPLGTSLEAGPPGAARY